MKKERNKIIIVMSIIVILALILTGVNNMPYVKQIWTDRSVEFPMRFSMVQDATTNTVTLTEEPGTISADGSKISAERMNHIEDGIAQNSTDIEDLKSGALFADNFSIVTGTIEMPEAGSSSYSANTTVDYPDGLSKDNCVVVSLMGHSTANDNWTTIIPTNSSLSVYSGTGNLFASLQDSGIFVSSSKVDTDQTRRDVTFRMVLMKIEAN